MTMLDRADSALAAFIVKGQFAETAVATAMGLPEGQGQLTHSDVAARTGLRHLDEAQVASAAKMSVVYTAIAAFENTLRELISARMLEEKKEGWWEECVSSDIRKRAARRQEEEGRIRWHRSRGLSPIFYTDLDDLPNIVQQNWGVFEHTLQSVEWLRQITNSICRSRNVIMHSGELSLDDIERIGVNIRDFARQVGV